MEKSIYTREYALLLRLLREARERAGITQVELALRARTDAAGSGQAIRAHLVKQSGPTWVTST